MQLNIELEGPLAQTSTKLKGYQAIKRIQKRMKRRFKIKNDASRIIGRQVLHWLYKPNGMMFKKDWENLIKEGLVKK